jgi:NAD(P)-dependent dehydrogenase (short-subunit alcohol dehydrogenase family)
MSTPPVAIVTAASRGMGAAIARRLAGDGYRVSLMSRTPEIRGLAEELDGIGMTGSVTSPSDLETLVSSTLDALGRVDAVVCNTGHPPKGELLALGDEEWQEGLDLLLLNVVRICRLVAPVMERQGGGSIVNISAFGAIEPALSFPVSSVFRAGLGAFAKLFAERYGSAKIRMNNVLPGFVENYPVDEETKARIPLARPATTEEVAAAVSFLLSGGAGYITGQSLRVDGGITRSL